MITKKEFLDSMKHETRIIQHLSGKLSEKDLEYRPSDKQRSMLELLQYLTVSAAGPVKNALTGNWDHMEAMNQEAAKVTHSTFHAAMDHQMNCMEEWLKDWDEADLSEKDATMPWGTPLKAGAALIDMGLKCLVAYRMQLFLYAKAAGHVDLGPANCWAGIDWSPEDE